MDTLYHIFCESDRNKFTNSLGLPESLCSSVSSNFSLISVKSHSSSEYVHLKSSEGKLSREESPPQSSLEEGMENSPINPKSVPDDDGNVKCDQPDQRFDSLLKVLHDLDSFVNARKDMVNIYSTLKHKTWSCSSCENIMATLNHVILLRSRSGLSQLDGLLLWVAAEAECLRVILQCRRAIVTGQYVSAVILCQQISQRLHARAHEIAILLPGAHVTFDTNEQVNVPSGPGLPPVITWMWKCYLRFVVLIPIVFGEKRKSVIGTFLNSSSSLTSAQFRRGSHDSSVGETTPAVPFSPSPPTRHSTMVYPDHDTTTNTAIALERAAVKKAVDKFFVVSRGIYRQVSLIIVALTNDRKLVEMQYICPPKDQWQTPSLLGKQILNIAPHMAEPRSRDDEHESVLQSILSSSTDEDDFHATPLPRNKTSGGLFGTDVVVISRLSPATSVPHASGVVPPNMAPVRHNSTYHTSTRRLLGIVNSASMLHPSHLTPGSSAQNIVGAGGSDGLDSVPSSSSISSLATNVHSSKRRNSLMREERSAVSNPSSVAANSIPFSSRQLTVTTEDGNDLNEDGKSLSPRPSSPCPVPSTPLLIPESGDWINDHLDTIHAILEYKFQSSSGDSAHVSSNYESFDRLLKNVHKRKCLCVPMYNTSQAQQRTTIGTYIVSALNDNSSIESTVAPSSSSSKRIPQKLSDESPRPQLFLVGAAMHRYVPLQQHSSQFVDDSGRSIGACVRDICEILTADDIFSSIGGQM